MDKSQGNLEELQPDSAEQDTLYHILCDVVSAIEEVRYGVEIDVGSECSSNQHQEWLDDFVTNLICWGVDVRAESGSLKSVENTKGGQEIHSALQEIQLQTRALFVVDTSHETLKYGRKDVPLVLEAKDLISSSLKTLRGYVKTIRMAQASQPREGPYANMKERIDEIFATHINKSSSIHRPHVTAGLPVATGTTSIQGSQTTPSLKVHLTIEPNPLLDRRDVASAPEYQYEKIAPPIIRILHLTPSAENGRGDTTLAGTLRTMSLDSPKAFDAISYACGEPKYDFQIFVDGKTIMVTKNCHDGLRYLRDIGVSDVWVDAVSINAKDLDERNKQILLMTKIYGVARRVYIWLGMPSPACERALDWLNDASVTEHPLLGARLALFPDLLRLGEIRKALPVFADVLRANLRRLGLTRPLPDCDSEALQDLTGRQWFTRQWTIQEAAIASEGWVVCGTRKVRWNHLVLGLVKAYKENLMDEQITKLDPMRAMFQFWVDVTSVSNFKVWPHRRWLNSWFKETSALSGKWMALLDCTEDYGRGFIKAQLALAATIVITRLLQALRPLDSIPVAALIVSCLITAILTPPKTNPHWDRELRKSFIDVLYQTRRQQATVKKDKLYALYGLLKQLEIELLENPSYDDRHSLEDAYRSFTVSVIQWHRSLEILLEASGSWGTDAPSWVPDWSRTYKRIQVSREEMGSLPAKTHNMFNFSKDFRQLLVSGRKIGKVIFMAGPIDGEHRSLNQICQNAMTLRDWLKRSVNVYDFSTVEVCCFLVSALPEQRKCSDVDLQAWAMVILEDEPSITEDEQGDADLGMHKAPRRCIPGEIRMLGLHLRPGLDGASWRRLLKLATNQRIWYIHQHIVTNLSGGLAPFVARIDGSKRFALGLGAEHIHNQDKIVRFASPGVPMVVRSKNFSVENESFHLIGAVKLSQVAITVEKRLRDEEGPNNIFTLI